MSPPTSLIESIIVTHVVLLLLGVLVFDLINLVRKVHSVVWSVVGCTAKDSYRSRYCFLETKERMHNEEGTYAEILPSLLSENYVFWRIEGYPLQFFLEHRETDPSPDALCLCQLTAFPHGFWTRKTKVNCFLCTTLCTAWDRL